MLYVIYRIEWPRLIKLFTPRVLRNGTLLAWLGALCWPIVELYNWLLSFKEAMAYRLYITPQVCYLQRLINDRFDPRLRRAYITDGVHYNPTYIYQQAEGKPQFMVKHLYTQGEAGQFKNDFIIHMPQRKIYDINEVKALVNAYKLAATKYIVISQ